MKPDIEYVYNALKKLRFDFKESDRKLFPNEYTFDYDLDRYVRVDGNDLYISKDTFKPLEEELEYAEKFHNLEKELDVDLVEFISEMIYVLKHSNQIRGYTSKGKEITTDFGYVEEFIEDLKAAIKDKCE